MILLLSVTRITGGARAHPVAHWVKDGEPPRTGHHVFGRQVCLNKVN